MAMNLLLSLTVVPTPVMWIYTDNIVVFWSLLRKEARTESNQFWLEAVLEKIENREIVIKPIWIGTKQFKFGFTKC